MNNPVRPHILFLPRWYPHRYDPMPGLFIRYQAEALSSFCDVTVVYVHPDPECPNRMEAESASENGVRVIRVYYRPGHGPARRWLRFYKAHQEGFAMTGSEPPDLIHVHVLTREGAMGCLFSRKYRIPFVISEHWSRYFPENDFFRGRARKWFTQAIVSRAAAVLPVSGKLMEAMMAKGLHHPAYQVVPNVIDETRFMPGQGNMPGEKKTILHVSCFDDRAKNISGLLEAVNRMKRKRNDFRVRLVGEGPDLDELKAYSDRLGLTEEEVAFAGLKEGQDLVAEYGNADFTVLSSRFETFGTVVVESLACGTPVLATGTGIAPEVITRENGLLIPPGDGTALLDGLERMLDHCRTFDRFAVRRTIEGKFTAGRIAGQLMDIYNSAIAGNRV